MPAAVPPTTPAGGPAGKAYGSCRLISTATATGDRALAAEATATAGAGLRAGASLSPEATASASAAARSRSSCVAGTGGCSAACTATMLSPLINTCPKCRCRASRRRTMRLRVSSTMPVGMSPPLRTELQSPETVVLPLELAFAPASAPASAIEPAEAPRGEPPPPPPAEAGADAAVAAAAARAFCTTGESAGSCRV